ncbi:formimidoylglutamate deiminase [Gynuella sunshinyii]|uniref:Cytosine deaminase and related metal-dependent hydrolase n=1 Tax=Gynuella sunshinyii YC6258 TaxID=1445510 RepID=A0A0C5V737_9GAMM|nr:formimidoylglutamate deiminase [Gynuella sunshinyii]AJQ95225.1 cytosine deaminase and related metal-dependent hydrolase [Gynuella sunshinyii YC6258]
MSHQFFAPRALLPNGWANHVLMKVEDGVFTHLQPDTHLSHLVDTHFDGSVTVLAGPVLPTVANLHSHAFQRLMAGMAEVAIQPQDSFWSWRDAMYRLVAEVSVDDLETIASWLYIELLKGGYSQVAEFHYLHHLIGSLRRSGTEMGESLIRAADQVGIGLTLLPALYQYGGFAEQSPSRGQRRFIQSTSEYMAQYQQYQLLLQGHSLHRLGICFHSLRAVSLTAIDQVLAQLHSDEPIHIHIAEQQKEVDDCLNWSGKRPVELLLERFAVNSCWSLIHATHLTSKEMNDLACSGAVAGICPTTEANLGDGIFPATEFEQAGGLWGVGSDSHVSTSLQEELRWFEYGQRLQQQRRNRLWSPSEPRVGDHLLQMALAGGNRACGVQLGLSIGGRADFMVWDEQQPFVRYSRSEDLLNRWLFAMNVSPIRDVYVAGECQIQEGRHRLEDEINLQFGELLRRFF